MFEQRTVTKDISFSGIGLHSGKIANVTLKPGDVNTGICLVRTDVLDKNNIIQLEYFNVSEVRYSTQISNNDGVFINTVEHLMAAIWAMKISNLIIEIDSEELPIMNGSSKNFIFMLEAIGVKKQQLAHQVAKINRKISIKYEDGRSIEVEPAENFIATFYLSDSNKVIDKSHYTFDESKQSFINDISLARTYCKLQDVNMLKSMGLAAGGGLHNAIVVDSDSVLNDGGLNYTNEFVRHKILDLIGDIALCKYRIAGHFVGHNSGHEMNNKLMREIFSNAENYTIIA